MAQAPAPAGFPSCQKCPYLRAGNAGVCYSCVTSVHPLPAPAARCPICQRPIAPPAGCGNPVCNWSTRSIDRVHAIAYKTGAIDKRVKLLKYDGVAGWGVIFGRLVLGWLQAHATPDTYDLITINPTHPERTPIRHTETILRAARNDDLLDEWPFDDPDDLVIEKWRPTTASARGNWHQKKAAADELESALRVRKPDVVVGARILVLDDVTTTLLQLRAVARVLERSAAASVEGLVIARQTR